MYLLRPPSPLLAGIVERYWFVDARAAPLRLQVDVFVDGQADLVFNFGAPWQREVPGRAPALLHRSALDAQRRHPLRVRQAGAVHLVGVRFALGGLGAVSPHPVGRWTDQTPPPEAVWGPTAAALEAALRAAPDIDAQAALLDAHLIAHLQPQGERRAAAGVVAALQAAPPRTTVGALAQGLGLSPRALERLCDRQLGLSPRLLLRVVRFQRALRALMHGPAGTLTALAHEVGYFDQAHFVREFRALAGGAPGAHRAYFPPAAPADFAPNLVAYMQAEAEAPG
jgi:AraC-like DNA-binding protein